MILHTSLAMYHYKINWEHMFSVEAMVCGYHGTTWLGMQAPIENLSCERQVGNIHNTFEVQKLATKDS